MAVKLDAVKDGDTLYYPLSSRPGEYHVIHVISVAAGKQSAVIDICGRKQTVGQTNFNRYRRTPPPRRER